MLATPPIPSHVYTTQGVLDTPCWLHHQFHHTCIQHKVCWTRHAGYTTSSITDTTQGILHMPSWLHLQFHNTSCAGHAKMASPPVPSQIYTTRGVLYIPSWLHLQFHPMQRLLVISTYLSSFTRHRHNERTLGIPNRLHFHFHHTQRESQNGYNFISITGRRCAAYVQLVTRPVLSVFKSTRQLSVTSIRTNTTTVTGIGYNNHKPCMRLNYKRNTVNKLHQS